MENMDQWVFTLVSMVVSPSQSLDRGISQVTRSSDKSCESL